MGGIQDIRNQVVNNLYPGEYAFQSDVYELILSAYDGHLPWSGDALASAIVYQLGWNIVSVSSDWSAMPKIYMLGKLHTTLHLAS